MFLIRTNSDWLHEVQLDDQNCLFVQVHSPKDSLDVSILPLHQVLTNRAYLKFAPGPVVANLLSDHVRQLIASSLPTAMGLGLALFSVDELEYYLKFKYKDQFEDYQKNVPHKCIPFIW